MLHRVRIGLHDEYQIDATLLDHLEGLPVSDRGPTLLRYLRVGFQVAQQQVDSEAAFREACMPGLKEGVGQTRPAPAKPARVAAANKKPAQAEAPRVEPRETTSPAPEPSLSQLDSVASVTRHGTQEPELLSADPGALADEDRAPDRDEVSEPAPEKPAGDSFARMRDRANSN